MFHTHTVSQPVRLHLDSLPLEQLAVWDAFRDADLTDFCLYGGTALALRFGHRLSVDFDFFTKLVVTPQIIHHRVPWLADHHESTLQQAVNSYVVTVRAPNSNTASTVKLSFFGNLNLPFLEVPSIADNGIALASTRDLLATKLKVINQRIESKDYLDIAEILHQSSDPARLLEQGLADMKLIFPDASPAETLKALCWFHGGDLENLPARTKHLLQSIVGNVGKLPDPDFF
jgi:hypothetical protein